MPGSTAATELMTPMTLTEITSDASPALQLRRAGRRAHPRVRHEHVDAAPQLLHARDRPLDLARVAHVRRQRQRLAARALDLARDFDQRLGPPRQHADARPAPPPLDRQRAPDAGRSAGDEHDLIFPIEAHPSHLA